MVAEGGGVAAVPTPRTRSPASIAAGALISLLFCHANYSELAQRPPPALNDSESIERGQTGAGEGRQSPRAGWHLNSLFSALHRNYIGPLEFLPAYFSRLFLHQNGAVTRQDELGGTKDGAKEATGVVSSAAKVKRRRLGSASAWRDKAVERRLAAGGERSHFLFGCDGNNIWTPQLHREPADPEAISAVEAITVNSRLQAPPFFHSLRLWKVKLLQYLR